MTEHILKVPIGDWSCDGHNQSSDYYIISNYPVEDLQQAYKDTCKKIGLQLNHNENYTGLPECNGYGSWRQIATEYQDSEIEEEALEILIEHGCTMYGKKLTKGNDYLSGGDMFELFMWFISYSMPKNFEYRVLEAQAINGYWGNLNVQIGYGCFY
jgi:hypothetical protein